MKLFLFLFFLGLVCYVSCDCTWSGSNSSYESTCLQTPCAWCGIDTNGTFSYECINKNSATCAELKAANDEGGGCQIFDCSFGLVLSATFFIITSLIFFFF
ncbi:hypothetical protein M0811_08144 [Anaeramoeba ignava]|uniref:Uncharacterized protein n=1 Tax=Anaeramoeba ignava TaxID=1746090 RepID=A0A9Q0RB80_ANAIG|nr:hypothetical protein M0811_08144 [Anaeramoeba ignava]